MQLEDYFQFLGPDDIRLKGSRIGIETILSEYLFRSQTPEEIAKTYPTLSLEQVYATILYYLHNKEAIHAYMTEWVEFGRRVREQQQRALNPADLRLRQTKAERDKDKQESEGVRAA